nr:hypothetical protein Iba_chr06aCG15580 [Ipomoea batatas]GMD06232.1 hypothetical protein Iba_chr06bCG14040 [Ipomoea batatas]GMD06236.1 hypothetical protein Iba_chr06bCG14080 [Ipomoea batatas]
MKGGGDAVHTLRSVMERNSPANKWAIRFAERLTKEIKTSERDDMTKLLFLDPTKGLSYSNNFRFLDIEDAGARRASSCNEISIVVPHNPTKSHAISGGVHSSIHIELKPSQVSLLLWTNQSPMDVMPECERWRLESFQHWAA